MTKVNDWAPFMLTLCIAIYSCHAQLHFTITTPTANAQFSTWISLLSSSVLPDSTPGYFLGAVDAKDVQKACSVITGRQQQSFTAIVMAHGETSDRQIQLVALNGRCDASPNSPVGVEMVFTDNNGTTKVIICDGSAWSAGCAVYETGEHVNSIYNGAIKGNSTKGFVVGVDTPAATCPAFGQAIAVLCARAVVFVSTVRSKLSCPVCLCFPGDATVLTSTGQKKYISELSVGDEVAVLGKHNNVQFESIYAFGHADNMSMASYIRLQLETVSQEELHSFFSSKTLYISPLHFAPIISEGQTQMIYKRAKDINIGDLMLITDNKVITHAYVTGKSKTLKKGLYNPFTMGGTLIVDGVIASVHSEWFLDAILDSLALTQYIPLVYQVVLYPVRILYHILGRHYYLLVYHYVDKFCDIPTMGTNHGGKITQILVTSTICLLIVTIRYYFKKKTYASM